MGSNAVQGVPNVVATLRGQPCGLVEDEEAFVLVQHAGLQLTGNCSALGVKLPTCMQAQGFVASTLVAASSARPRQSVAGWIGVVHRPRQEGKSILQLSLALAWTASSCMRKSRTQAPCAGFLRGRD